MMTLLDMVICVTVAAVLILMAVGTAAAAAIVTVGLIGVLKDLIEERRTDHATD